MKQVLVPVDGSEHALAAVRAVLNAKLYPSLERVHLATAQVPLYPQGVHMGLSQTEIDAYYREESEFALSGAQKLLEAAGVPYETHSELGQVAESLVDLAKRLDVDEIVMGSRGLGSISSVMLGSIATKVLHLAETPVTLVK